MPWLWNLPIPLCCSDRYAHEQDPGVQRFVKAYQSPEVRAYIDDTFKGAYSAAW